MNNSPLPESNQNFEAVGDVPIMRCWWKDEKRTLIITDTCGYCGKRHQHAYPGMKPGEYAHWSSHCDFGYDPKNIGYYLMLVDDQPLPAPQNSKRKIFRKAL